MKSNFNIHNIYLDNVLLWDWDNNPPDVKFILKFSFVFLFIKDFINIRKGSSIVETIKIFIIIIKIKIPTLFNITLVYLSLKSK